MNRIFVLILIFIAYHLNGQELELFYGQNYSYEKYTNPAINQETPSIDNYILWTPMFGISMNKRQKIWLSFDVVKIWNHIYLDITEEYEQGLPTGFGTSITQLRRLGFGYQYLLTNPEKKFKVSLRSFLFLSKRRSNRLSISRSVGVPFYSPDKFYVTAFDKVSLIPSLGFKLSYSFLKRFKAIFWVNKFVGFTVLQEGRWEHSYKGVVQPDAISENKGSGFYISIGIGYSFKKEDL